MLKPYTCLYVTLQRETYEFCLRKEFKSYEAQTRHVSDTDTYNYTELCDFFKLLAVSECQCPCHVWCPCLYPCFIV